MATAVFFHAHPDDEAIITGGTMLLASRAGHRVVVVCATDGALGAAPVPAADADADAGGGGGEGDQPIDLAALREQELRDSAEILGARRVEVLGYRDSGMAGDPANDDPECFWQADQSEAAERLAAILREEGADLLTCYDDNGGYGHPDHIQVHRVGVRAAALAGVGLVFEATMDREHFRAAMQRIGELAAEAGLDMGSEADQSDMEAELESEGFGAAAADITHRIDVSAVLEEKRSAMLAHASQIPADSFFVSLPEEAFALMSATEWFILRGSARGAPRAADIFAALTARPPDSPALRDRPPARAASSARDIR